MKNRRRKRIYLPPPSLKSIAENHAELVMEGLGYLCLGAVVVVMILWIASNAH